MAHGRAHHNDDNEKEFVFVFWPGGDWECLAVLAFCGTLWGGFVLRIARPMVPDTSYGVIDNGRLVLDEECRSYSMGRGK